MPGNRRVKNLRKCIVNYIDVGGLSCTRIGWLHIYVSVL
jgi:hypothetical protein